MLARQTNTSCEEVSSLPRLREEKEEENVDECFETQTKAKPVPSVLEEGAGSPGTQSTSRGLNSCARGRST